MTNTTPVLKMSEVHAALSPEFDVATRNHITRTLQKRFPGIIENDDALYASAAPDEGRTIAMAMARRFGIPLEGGCISAVALDRLLRDRPEVSLEDRFAIKSTLRRCGALRS
jgi:hypothetical protein